jgi:hypothetical protein
MYMSHAQVHPDSGDDAAGSALDLPALLLSLRHHLADGAEKDDQRLLGRFDLTAPS